MPTVEERVRETKGGSGEVEVSADKHTRFLVTGGTGFLGSHVVGKLRARGYSKISIPRSCEYDLTNVQEVKRVLRDNP
jgi:GDP-L-fucose synthase